MSFLLIPIQIQPNTGFGQGAMQTGQGERNVGISTDALAQITNTGEDNVAIGYRSGRFLSTEDGNVLVGSSTMENVTGSFNIALGLNALKGVTSINKSNQNVAIGNESLFQVDATAQCVAVGQVALRTNKGSSNSALGYGAGYSNFRGENNTFVGANSGYNFQTATLGESTNNTFVGSSSGFFVTTGKKNSILGSYNGNQGGLDIRTLSNYVVLSDGDGNPRLWIDNTGAVNIPGGTVLPGGVANGVLYLNASKVMTSGSALTFQDALNSGLSVIGSGSRVITARSTDISGSAIGYFSAEFAAGQALQMRAGSGYTFLLSTGATDPLLFGTAGVERMRINSAGDVAIGTAATISPNARLSLVSSADYGPGLIIGSNGSAANWSRLDFKNTNAAQPTILYQDQIGTFGIRTDGAYPIIFLTNGNNERMRIDASGNMLVTGVGGLGYGAGSGGSVTQTTSRTTGVTLNKTNGQITLVGAAGTTTWQSFTVTNSTVAATDVVHVVQATGADLYQIHVTAVAAGSFRITFATTGGTTTEQPVFNFAVLKAVTF